MSYCSEAFVTHLGGYDKQWVSAVQSDARVTYAGERIRIDVLAQRINTVKRMIGDETYHIWTEKRDVSRLGEVKLLITEKEKESSNSNEDKSSVKYLVSNKIGAPASHLIAYNPMRWRSRRSSGTPSRTSVWESANSGMPQVPANTGTC